MHTTIYIDHDEEITSVVDRLRKATTPDIILVIPQRAIVLQSSINLRLLRREADKFSKQIMIVTQDELGTRFAQKANIFSQVSMEGINEKEEVKELFVPKISPVNNQKNNDDTIVRGLFGDGANLNTINQNKKSEIANNYQGSNRRVDDFRTVNNETPRPHQIEKNTVHIPVTDLRRVARPQVETQQRNNFSSSIHSRPKIELKNPWPKPKDTELVDELPKVDSSRLNISSSRNSPLGLSTQPPEPLRVNESQKGSDRDNHIQQLFNPSLKEYPYSHLQDETIKNRPIILQEVPVSKRIRRTLLTLGIVCLFVAGAAATYLFVPHSEITVWPRIEESVVTLEIHGDDSLNVPNSDSKIIPIRIIEQEGSGKINLSATGSVSSADQKARGLVTIYNEFSSEDQILVATTRIISADDKLFRLAESITVPGYTKENEILNPGSVQVRVVADGSGEEYNIGPSKFSIPGFQGTPKYTRFRVESLRTMIGGGLKGEGIPIISDDDVLIAKKQSEENESQKIIAEIVESLPEGTVLLTDSTKIETIDWTAVPDVGMAATSFEYSAKVKVFAVVYLEEDVRQFVIEAMEKNSVITDGNLDIQIALRNTNVSVDFGLKKASWKAQAKIIVKSSVDFEDLKQEILGKDQDQISALLDRFPSIDRMDIDFLPANLPFPSRISRFPQRVKLQIGFVGDGG